MKNYLKKYQLLLFSYFLSFFSGVFLIFWTVILSIAKKSQYQFIDLFSKKSIDLFQAIFNFNSKFLKSNVTLYVAIPIAICLYTFYKHVYLRSKSSYSFYSILNNEDKALIKEIFKSLIAGILINSLIWSLVLELMLFFVKGLNSQRFITLYFSFILLLTPFVMEGISDRILKKLKNKEPRL